MLQRHHQLLELVSPFLVKSVVSVMLFFSTNRFVLLSLSIFHTAVAANVLWTLGSFSEKLK